jgi:hypothetical protein
MTVRDRFHLEVGNVLHFADRSIGNFNLGRDQDTPHDKQRVTISQTSNHSIIPT